MTNVEILKAMISGTHIYHKKDNEILYRLERLVQVDTKDGWQDGVIYVRVDGQLGGFVRPLNGFVNFSPYEGYPQRHYDAPFQNRVAVPVQF